MHCKVFFLGCKSRLKFCQNLFSTLGVVAEKNSQHCQLPFCGGYTGSFGVCYLIIVAVPSTRHAGDLCMNNRHNAGHIAKVGASGINLVEEDVICIRLNCFDCFTCNHCKIFVLYHRSRAGGILNFQLTAH